MTHRTTWLMTLIALIAAIGLLAVACGGDDDTSTPTTAASAAANTTTTAASGSPATGDVAAKLAAMKGDTTGVTDTEIKIGSYFAKTGPAAAYYPIVLSWQAYFDDVNAKGGINGRKVTFNVQDDGYNPVNAKNVVTKLIEQDQVFMLFNGLGTPSGNGVLDDVKAAKVPSLFLASGDAKWAEQGSLIIGLQPDYVTEGTVLGKYAASHFAGKKAAIIYQNDDFGKEGQQGIKAGMGSALQIVDEETYEANAPDWNAQLTKATNAGAEVMLVYSTPTQYAAGVKYAKQQGKTNLIWLTSSVAASSSTAKIAEGGMDGTYTAGYIKDPSDQDPEIQKWRKWAIDKKLDPDTSFTYYGVMAAQHLEQLLKAAGPNLNRATLEYALENVAFTGTWKADLLLQPSIVTPKDHKVIEYMWVQQWNEAQHKFVYDTAKDLINLETTKK